MNCIHVNKIVIIPVEAILAVATVDIRLMKMESNVMVQYKYN